MVRSTRAITLLEVIVSVAIIGAIAAITFAVMNAVRRASITAECLTKFSQINEALMIYRDTWGNADAMSGSTTLLGLPHSMDPDSYLSLVPYGVSGDRQVAEFWSCPYGRTDREIHHYDYVPREEDFPYQDPEYTYSKASAILLGDTPVVQDYWHNPETVNLADPNEQISVVLLTLDGRALFEKVSGVPVQDGGRYSGHSLEEWVRIRRYDVWKRNRGR